MQNYFTRPYSFCKAESDEAERKPNQCENKSSVNEDKNNISAITSNVEYQIVIAERSYSLPTFTDEELKNEEWKTIKGFPKYLISNLGRVYSLKSDKILKPCLSPADKKNFNASSRVVLYDFITRRTKGKYKGDFKGFTCRISALVSEHFMIIPRLLSDCEDIVVVHKNKNPFDNRLSNLLYMSQERRQHLRSNFFKKKYQTNKQNQTTNKQKYTCYVFYRSKDINSFVESIKSGTPSVIRIVDETPDFVLLQCKNDIYKEMVTYMKFESVAFSILCSFPFDDKLENHLSALYSALETKKKHFRKI